MAQPFGASPVPPVDVPEPSRPSNPLRWVATAGVAGVLAIAAFAFGSQVASSATTSTAAPASLSQSQTPGPSASGSGTGSGSGQSSQVPGASGSSGQATPFGERSQGQMPGGDQSQMPGGDLGQPPMGGPGGMGRPAAGGTITAIDGTTITIAGDERTGGAAVVVEVSDATQVLEMGDPMSGAEPTQLTLADLAVGDTVVVLGTLFGDTVQADAIMVGDLPMPPDGGMGRPGMGGPDAGQRIPGQGMPGQGLPGESQGQDVVPGSSSSGADAALS
ncbi:MAG: hypothetical protein R2690_06895 [Acidimicrobiales bacterium]